MLKPLNLMEKKLNAETHRVIGEAKLLEFGEFVEHFTHVTSHTHRKFCNYLNITENPIFIDEEADESVSILHLSHSDNKTLSRILNTLGGICKEIEFLKHEAVSLYPSFLFYAEEDGGSIDNFKSIGNIIESLQRTANLISHAKHVIALTLNQLSGILEKGFYVSNSTCSFPEILNLFADLLLCLVKFDILFDQQVLKNHWVLYRRSIRNALHNSAHFNLDNDQLRSLHKTMVLLENSLLSGNIFSDSMESCLENKIIVHIKKSSLNIEFQNFLTSRISELEKDDDNILHRKMWLQLNVLVAFHYNIFENTDKKLTKRLLELNKQIPSCTLIGNILWYPEQFLLKHVQSLAKLIDEKSIENCRLNQIHVGAQNMPKETNKLCVQAWYFLIELDKKTKVNTTALKLQQLQEISILLVEGLQLIKNINLTIKWIMNIHVDKIIPVTRTILICISRLVELLKSIENAFNKNMLLIYYLTQLICQQLQHKALFVLVALKKNQTQEKSYKEQELDNLSALIVCENALKGPNTRWRLLVTSLALSACDLDTTSFAEIRIILNQSEIISRFTYFLKHFCDCSVLYWHYNYILPVYLSKLVSSKSNLSKYYSVLSAMTDCENIVGKEVSSHVNKILSEHFIWSTNQTVESNLRLQTHLHLQLPPSDPFQSFYSLNFDKFLPVPLNKAYKSIKNETEHYLSTMFYNLTTVVLHDWKTYGEMRRLATLQYSLQTVDDDLPMQTLDQGLDVLEIMRNINIFVQKYLYNLNTQVFIEESSNNKHLNSINILHVANSIRTHGIGIMNTTVNYTYQFLKNKFRIFSQFLFDEQIKSRLLRDLRYFIDHKNECNQMYPYDRAEKFNTGIRSLGSLDGESYLDLFRKVITQIGNAMGYVRLIRSGGNRCLAEGTCFIPNFTEIEEFKDVSETEELSDITKNAVNFLIKDLHNFTENFENTTAYFKLLFKGFLSHFRNPNNIHLQNFYIIVPSLTINYVEHSLTCKERLFKKNKANSAFTDDGFALGLAYIIELLDQKSRLSSLHWFESVQRKFNIDQNRTREQTLTSNHDDIKLQQALTLTERKINIFKRVNSEQVKKKQTDSVQQTTLGSPRLTNFS